MTRVFKMHAGVDCVRSWPKDFNLRGAFRGWQSQAFPATLEFSRDDGRISVRWPELWLTPWFRPIPCC